MNSHRRAPVNTSPYILRERIRELEIKIHNLARELEFNAGASGSCAALRRLGDSMAELKSMVRDNW